MSREPILLIGLGQRWRSDDGLGPWFVEALREAPPPGVELLSASDGFDLLSHWQPHSRVYVIDALRGAGAPGSAHRIDALRQSIPHGSITLSHGFGLAEAIALARSLRQLPKQLILIGIEGTQFGWGQTFSAPVQAAAERLLPALREELAAAVRRTPR